MHLRAMMVIALACCWLPSILAQEVRRSAFEELLLKRIAGEPASASNWRLLGRIRLDAGDISGAIDACNNAVAIDPHNASAHFDLARALLADNDLAGAGDHFQVAYDIAPQSEYGADAAEYLERLGRRELFSEGESGDVDDQANRFTGVTVDSARVDPGRPLSARLELGALYNSNVQLAPLSRDVTEPGLAGPQGFLAPQILWQRSIASDREIGAYLRGNFTVNEAGLAAYNLQEYQPGFFFERAWTKNQSDIFLHTQYDFALDQFSGNTFATRHSLVVAVDVMQANVDSTFYWAVDDSNFNDDGLDPAVDSLDGWTYTLGAHRTWLRDGVWFPWVRCGADLQWAPLEGDDFAYRGVFGYMEVERGVGFGSVLGVQLGCGYRDYPQYTSFPSRNELLYRAQTEIRKSLNRFCEIVGVVSYDRFACDNEQFDTSRVLAGIYTVWQY